VEPLDLAGIKDWVVEQVGILLTIAFIILLVITAYKRAWIGMAAVVVGFAFIGIFVFKPEILLALSEWMGEKLNIGG